MKMPTKWSDKQPKIPGLYLRAKYNQEIIGAYTLTGTMLDPQGQSLWLGPIPLPIYIPLQGTYDSPACRVRDMQKHIDAATKIAIRLDDESDPFGTTNKPMRTIAFNLKEVRDISNELVRSVCEDF